MANAVAKSSSNASENVSPSQTLYLQNLPIKIHKPELRRQLYILFSTYGSVLDVNAVKSAQMRGQAHILFRDVPTATQAMRHCQGFEFFGRPIVRIALVSLCML